MYSFLYYIFPEMTSDLPSPDVFLEVIEFLHRLCLDFITYVYIWLHGFVI